MIFEKVVSIIAFYIPDGLFFMMEIYLVIIETYSFGVKDDFRDEIGHEVRDIGYIIGVQIVISMVPKTLNRDGSCTRHEVIIWS